ncbi:hypothetical protein U1Q18_010707 [Sarracenia purpurea var. burkii]
MKQIGTSSVGSVARGNRAPSGSFQRGRRSSRESHTQAKIFAMSRQDAQVTPEVVTGSKTTTNSAIPPREGVDICFYYWLSVNQPDNRYSPCNALHTTRNHIPCKLYTHKPWGWSTTSHRHLEALRLIYHVFLSFQQRELLEPGDAKEDICSKHLYAA